MFKGITVEAREGADNQYYAARVKGLGITAYGNSSIEALEKLKGMFSGMVDVNIKAEMIKPRVAEDKTLTVYW